MRISDWSSDVCSSDLDTYSTHLPQALSENCTVVPVRGTAKPLDRTDVPKPLPCALQAGNRLLHPLIANWNLPSLGCVSMEERRVGQECVSTFISRWWPDLSKKKKIV